MWRIPGSLRSHTEGKRIDDIALNNQQILAPENVSTAHGLVRNLKEREVQEVWKKPCKTTKEFKREREKKTFNVKHAMWAMT